MTPTDLYALRPCVLTFTPNNDIDQVLHYEVFKSAARDYDFRIVGGVTSQTASVHNYANVDIRAIREELKAKGLPAAEVDAFVEKYLTR